VEDLPFRVNITLPGTRQSRPVGKILCIGRNYAEHASEMKSDVPDEPMVFLKPPSALVRSGETVVIPVQSDDVHHEVELVAVIAHGGRHIPRSAALEHVGAYALGLDMTARDLQQKAKERRHPWSVAKGFDTFAPLGPLAPADEVGDPQDLTLQLSVNDTVRQQATTADMVFPVAELVHYCSTIFTLRPGDLIYTGTPEGVGPVAEGDVVQARSSACAPLRVRVRNEPRDAAPSR
jgi:2-keto-4-pentenoate hydratase/2-oxohepta-3-ene-1,7-dioic acid hydratase in catechol pathway